MTSPVSDQPDPVGRVVRINGQECPVINGSIMVELLPKTDAFNEAMTQASRPLHIYDADRRTVDPMVRALARHSIPHPLVGVQYGDGMTKCTHVKEHKHGYFCPQETQ